MIYGFCRFLCWLVGKVLFRHRVHFPDRVIEEGGALVVANHSSFLDPPMVGIAFRRPIHFFARRGLFRGPFAWLLPRLGCVPVDSGKNDTSSLKRALALLKGGERLLLFPEGTRSYDGELLPPQPGVGFLIQRCGVPVLPIRVFGAHEALPRGARFFRFHRVEVVVGEAVDFSSIPPDLRGRELYAACAEKVMESIAALELPPQEPQRNPSESEA